MKIYKESIVLLAGFLLLAFTVPGVAAGGSDCCDVANDGGTKTLTATVDVLDIPSAIMKIDVLEDSDIANDGRVLLGGTEAERTVTVKAWVFDRNGEQDILFEPTIAIKDTEGTTLVDTFTDVTPSQRTDDGFKQFLFELVLPSSADSGVYTVETVPTAGAEPLVSKIALYESVHWSVSADSVDFGSIEPTSTDITSTSLTISNLDTSAFSVGFHMDDFSLVGGDATIPAAQNVQVYADDVLAGALDVEGHIADVALLQTSQDTDGNIIPDEVTIHFEILDATPDESNTNSILPSGIYQSLFCVLVTADGLGDYAYKEGDGAYDYDETDPVGGWSNPDASSPEGPDGKGSLTFPDDY